MNNDEYLTYVNSKNELMQHITHYIDGYVYRATGNVRGVNHLGNFTYSAMSIETPEKF